MNTKDNQRARLSKQLLKNALMELMVEKGAVEKISVRELCLKAQLNRSTFYAHYNEPGEILAEIENDLLLSTEDHLKKIGNENAGGAKKYILSFLKYIKENRDYCKVLLIDSFDTAFRTRFLQNALLQFINSLNLEFTKESEQFIYSYLINGSAGIIIQWIRSDFIANEELICNLLFRLNENVLLELKEYIID